MSLSNNSLAFIALSNEYCSALENASQSTPAEFIAQMTRLLPRLYIAASDLQVDDDLWDEPYISPALDEDYYEAIRRGVESLLGPDDVYLETFEDDMKYSDTPISASVSEGLADIFQALYNFLEMVRDATDEQSQQAISAAREDFASYWSQTLCNVMRPLNHLRQNPPADE